MPSDQEIALQVKVPTFDAASTLSNAQTILGNQTRLQMLGRENTGQDITFRNQLIRDAAAHALDADSWDQAMRAAVQRGAPEAGQYIGRYTPLLQQRLFDAYAGTAPQAQGAAGSPAAPAGVAGGIGPPTDQLDRLYQNAPPQQMAASLQKLNALNDALLTVRDQPTWNAAMAQLARSGMPEAQQFGGAFSPLRVQQLFASIQPLRNYLQNRVAASAAGVPSPLVKNDVQNVGDVAYSVDPYAGTAKALTPPKPEKIGVDQYGLEVYGVRDANAPGGFRRIDPAALPAGGNTVDFAEAARRTQAIENATGNPAATTFINSATGKPASSAMGNGQFIEKTWLDLFKTTYPDQAKTMSDAQILALRADPTISNTMSVALARENADGLDKAGLPVTTASLTLAHRLGVSNATKVLNAAPNARLDDILPKQVLDANPNLRGQTANAYVQGIARQVGNDPIGATAPPPASNLDMHGDDYLKTLPPGKAEAVRMIAEGRAPFPSGFILKTPYGQWLQQAIGQFEPGFNAQVYQQRQRAYNDWYGGGKTQQSLRALDQGLNHTIELTRNVDQLGNWSFGPIANKPVNVAESAIGMETGYNPLQTNAHAVADEFGKVWKGAGLSDAEIRAWSDAFRVNGSIPQQKADVRKLVGLLRGAMDSYQDQHENSFGQNSSRLPPVFSPGIMAKLQLIDDWANNRAPAERSAAAPAVSAPPVPGAKLYQGKWYTRGPNGEAVPVAAQ